MRFTYIPEYDSHGELLGTTIKQTGGYFAGYTPEQLAAVAEPLYPECDPEFKRNALQSEFYEIHFNHCLRRRLESCLTSSQQPQTDADSPTLTTESGLNKATTDTASLSD